MKFQVTLVPKKYTQTVEAETAVEAIDKAKASYTPDFEEAYVDEA